MGPIHLAKDGKAGKPPYTTSRCSSPPPAPAPAPSAVSVGYVLSSVTKGTHARTHTRVAASAWCGWGGGRRPEKTTQKQTCLFFFLRIHFRRSFRGRERGGAVYNATGLGDIHTVLLLFFMGGGLLRSSPGGTPPGSIASHAFVVGSKAHTSLHA